MIKPSLLTLLLLALCGSALGKVTRGGSKGTITSKVVCTASASAGAWEDAVNGWAIAVVRSVKAICSKNYDGTAKTVKKAVGQGVAYASAYANVYANCSYKGKRAKGCAAARAWGSAWADAWATGKAVVKIQEVIASDCACSVGAEVAAEGVAKVVVGLWADAYAYASTKVCRSGDEPANEGSAYVYCFGSALVDLYARAVAEYLYSTAGCHHHSYASASVDIKAVVKAEYTTDYGCYEYEYDPLPCEPYRCETDIYGYSYAVVWEE